MSFLDDLACELGFSDKFEIYSPWQQPPNSMNGSCTCEACCSRRTQVARMQASEQHSWMLANQYRPTPTE